MITVTVGIISSCPLEMTPHDNNIQESINADKTASEQILLRSISLNVKEEFNCILILIKFLFFEI